MGRRVPVGVPLPSVRLSPVASAVRGLERRERAGRVRSGVRPSSAAADAASEACGLSRGELSVRRRPLALASSRSGWAWRACDRRAVDRRGRALAVPPHASEDEGCEGPAEVIPTCHRILQSARPTLHSRLSSSTTEVWTSSGERVESTDATTREGTSRR